MSITIYHIEDNLGDQVIVKRLLGSISNWSISLVHFKKLNDALAKLDLEEPDLILLDLSLPDASNLAALEEIIKLYPESCVVVLTGNMRKDLGYSAIRMGAEDFLNKEDLQAEALEKTLRFSLARNKLKRENNLLKKDLFINRSRLNNVESVNFAYIIRTDLEGNYTYVNKLFKDTFFKTDEQVIGQNDLQNIYAEDHTAIKATRALSLERPGQIFSVTLRKPLLIPGLLRSTIWDFVALTNQKGDPIEIQCTGFDLTEQYENQQEIRRIRKVNELILRNSFSLNLLLDNDFRVEYEIGDNAALFEGMETLVERNFEELIHPSDLNKWKIFTEKRRNQNKDRSPLTLRIVNDDKTLWVNISMNYIKDYYSLIIRNVNQEHLNEITTIYNEQKYRALFENNPNIILTADFETGKVLEVNAAFVAKLKINSEHTLGKTIEELKIWQSESSHQSFNRQLAAKGEYRLAQTELVCADGSLLTVNLSGVIIKLNEQLLKILIAEDISNEIKLHDQLKTQEEIYRSLINNSSNLYLVLDKNLKIIFGSPQWSVLNYNYQNIVNSNFLAYISATDRKYIQDSSAQLWETKSKASFELKAFKLVDRFGGPRWFTGKICYLNHFPQQKEGVIVWYLEDIHKEYQLEKEKNSLHEQTVDAFSDLEQYKRVLDKHALVTLIDPEGCFLYVNDYFCLVNGYNSHELLGKSTRILNSNYHSAGFYEDLWTTVQAGEIWQGDFRNRKKDGSLYWSKTTIAPRVDDSTGKIINYISIHTDITELKLTQQNLNISKINLSNTLDSINQEVWSINREYELITFNKLFQSNFEEFFNHDLRIEENMLQIEALPQDLRTRFAKRYDKAFEGEVNCYFDEYVDPRDDKKKYSEVRVFPTLNHNGGISGATVFAQDITERKEREEEMKELLIRFELATKANNIGIWDLDLETNAMLWDECMYELYEMENTGPLKWNEWRDSLTTVSRNTMLPEFNEALKSSPNFASSFKVNLKSGIKSIATLSKIIRNDKGKAVRAIGLNWDITQTVENEEKLHRSLQEKADILSSMNDGFLVLDEQLKVVSINTSACKILNTNELQVLGTSLWPDLRNKELSTFYPVIKKCLDTNTSGTVIGIDQVSQNWIDACIYPQGKGLVIIFKDITVERSKTIELEKVRNNQAALINTTLDLIWSVNINLELVAFNNQFSQQQQEKGALKPIAGSSVFNKHSVEYVNLWKLRYEKALAGDTISETIVENKFVYLLSVYPIFDTNNMVEGLACYARDITENQAYLNTIQVQNNELKDIAWMQSHIVRAPIARILGLVELINEEKLVADRNLDSYLQSIDMSAKELDNIVEKITKKTYSAKIKGV